MPRFFLIIFQAMMLEIVLVSGAFLLTVNQPSWLFTALLLLIIGGLSAWTARHGDRSPYLVGLVLCVPILSYLGWYFAFVRPELAVYLFVIVPIVVGASLTGSGLATLKK